MMLLPLRVAREQLTRWLIPSICQPLIMLLSLLTVTLVFQPNYYVYASSLSLPSDYDSVTQSIYGRIITYPRCKREPENTQVPVTPGSNGFRIKISGNPEKYVPGEVYTSKMID